MMLKIKALSSGYTKENMILKGIDLEVVPGEVVGIIGQNGCGKSTFAKSIMNLVPVIRGEILFDGVSLSGKSTSEIAKLGVGFFFQGGRIFPHLTVKENIDFALRGYDKKQSLERLSDIKEYFEFLNTGRDKFQASDLSGGERNLLALSLILINKPKLLILDEPSAGLSPMNMKAFYKVLHIFREMNQTAVLLIEQNVSMAFENSNTVNLLETGTFSLTGEATKEFEEEVISNFFSKERTQK